MEPAEETFQTGIGKKERIPAGEEDIADSRCVFEIIDGGIPLGLQLLIRYTGNDPRARAVPAVGGAAISHQKKNAIRVAVHQPGDRHVGILATRICHFGGVGERFLDTGDDLPADGAVRVGGVDEVEKMGGDCGGELGAGEQDSGAFFLAEGEVFLDIGEALHAVFELPLGGVPVCRVDVFLRPVAGGVGFESRGGITQDAGILGGNGSLSKAGLIQRGGWASFGKRDPCLPSLSKI